MLRFLFPLLMSFTLVGCFSLGSRLPASMPDDFSLEVSESGGMLPYSVTTTYALSGSRYQKSYLYQGEKIEGDFSFKLREEDLRELYHALLVNQFDRITTHKEEIYDRGGVQVTVKVQGKMYDLADAGMSVVDGPWLDSWKSIYTQLGVSGEKALKQAGSRVSFKLAENVKDLKDLYIGFDLTPVYSHAETFQDNPSVSVFPGRYVLVLGFDPTTPYQYQVVDIDGPRVFMLQFDGKALRAR